MSVETQKDVQTNELSEETANADAGGRCMTVFEHLEELRTRLIVCIITLLLTTVVSLIFTGQLIEAMKAPLPTGARLIYTAPMEMLSTYFKVALYAGIILAMPVLLYEFTAFVAPAMTHREKRYFFALLPAILLCFAAGVAFGYKLLLPTTLPYLLGLFMDIAEPLLRVGEYISFVSTFLFWLGLCFQTPLVIYTLAALRVVSPRRLRGLRKIAIVVSFVLGAVVTPTPDPINQLIVALPVYLLFEIGILLARLAYRGVKEQAAS